MAEISNEQSQRMNFESITTPMTPRPVCGAKKRNGVACKRLPSVGRRRCKYHGGATLSAGPGHPTWKHGRYSKAFGRFADAVDQAIDDPNLIDIRRGVAGALIALEQSGERLTALDTPAFRADALRLYGIVRDAEDPEKRRFAWAELGELLNRGVQYDDAFERVVERSEAYAQRVENALKIRISATAALSTNEVSALLVALLTIMLERSKDRSMVLDVAQTFDRVYLEGRLARAGISFVPRSAISVEG